MTLHHLVLFLIVSMSQPTQLADGRRTGDGEPPASKKPPAAVLRCAGANGRSVHAIGLDGGVACLDVTPFSGITKADGSASARVVVEGRGPESRALIEIARQGSKDVELIAPGADHPRHLGWTPEGMLLFEGSRESRRGIFTLAVDRPGRPVQRLSPEDRDCILPAPSPSGAVAWAEVTGRDGKMPLQSIVIAEAGARRELLGDVPASALAFSPDASKLAVGCLGSIRVLEVATGKELRRWEFSALDQRLYAHLTDQLLWSPDGSMLAFTCRFAGGRMSARGEPAPLIFGDQEVFVLIQDPGTEPRLVVAQIPGGSGALQWK